jgi:para-aminobenzoate synthetase
LFSYLDERMKALSVEKNEELPFSFQLGFVGYFGYEMKAETGGERRHISRTPDAMLLFADRMVVFDHAQRCIYLVAAAHRAQIDATDSWFDHMRHSLSTYAHKEGPAIPPKVDIPSLDEDLCMRHSREQYLELIAKCQQKIRDGESYELCLTNTFEFPPLINPLNAYLQLRTQSPAPMASYFRFSDFSILSASPERLVRINDGCVEAKPVKGTIRRGSTPDEDFALREHLRSNEKDIAENLMIVDLLRNDLGRVCDVGSVVVPSMFDVETLATVHEMVSTITGKLRAERSSLDCLRAVFPGGSMTGAPKVRTMQILDELEAGPRGVYSGAIGYLSLDGDMDWSVVIRTIVNTADAAFVGAGGAITALSDAALEFDEVMLKAEALRRVIADDQICAGGVHEFDQPVA